VKSRLVKFTTILLTLAFCLLSTCEIALGQIGTEEPKIIPSNDSGEVTSATLNMMADEIRKSGERLFVIVHCGAGEQSQIGFWRLYSTRQRIIYLTKSFDPKTTIFAEGERVEGEGQIEFYIGSRLRLVTLAPRNRMPNLTCCDDYFPPAKRKLKQKKRKN
jgi:hypothetical protein